MFRPMIILATLVLSSCGAFKYYESTHPQGRDVASSPLSSLLTPNEPDLSQRMDEKLSALHSYYIIGQRQLKAFDEQISSIDLEKMYTSPAYLQLIAVRTQAEEIEHQIIEAVVEGSSDPEKSLIRSRDIILGKIRVFKDESQFQQSSMENLVAQLPEHSTFLNASTSKKKFKEIMPKNFDLEYARLQKSPEFQVYEKNIEHLAFVMEVGTQAPDKRFYPNAGKPGNLTGNEFPAKVWALTFDDGPGKATSQIIVDNLKKRNLKATFFQLTSKALELPATAKMIREAGMEIASHSYTHKELTKVGPLTLEKEITTAIKDLKTLHGVELKFFRLPYGAGVGNATIRAKIAASNLIHVFWNIDTLDWMAQEPQKIVTRTLALMKKTTRDQGVILFHDIHQRTALATPQIMDYLKQGERRACTLSEIVNQMNEGSGTVCPLTK